MTAEHTNGFFTEKNPELAIDRYVMTKAETEYRRRLIRVELEKQRMIAARSEGTDVPH